MIVIAELNDIAGARRRFGPVFFHQADGSLDNMSQLPRTLIDAA
ncbi:hypothetical protein [Devosia aurantiaca]|nr:hypothetical protein [Devosia aurantiaca]